MEKIYNVTYASDSTFSNIGNDQEIKEKIEQILIAEDDIEISEILTLIVDVVIDNVNI